jgi:hypothetical protein
MLMTNAEGTIQLWLMGALMQRFYTVYMRFGSCLSYFVYGLMQYVFRLWFSFSSSIHSTIDPHHTVHHMD